MEISYNKAIAFCRVILSEGLIPNLMSSPGMGKSAIARQLADEANLQLIDHRMSGANREDQNGFPMPADGRIKMLIQEGIFPLESDRLPAGKDGWLLFLDELNQAPKDVLASCYKLLLDRMVGQESLHPNVSIMIAGNKMTDGAIAGNMGNALKSRVITLNLRVSAEEWLDNVAVPNKYDIRIIAYINHKMDALHRFDPNSTDDSFPCPRTWEFVNRLIRNEPDLSGMIELLAGTIGEKAAIEFVTYSSVWSNLISYKEIVDNPEYASIPIEKAAQWSVVINVVDSFKEEDIEKVFTYMNRISEDMRVIFFRKLFKQYPNLIQKKESRGPMHLLRDFLNEGRQ